ncbi:hypothetical protein P3M90_000775 [Salmonella enterica]|uniref:Uncharacterized protein n=9 Tax=Salmonella enterica TaxID=28901 RepID=A0A702PH19_SALHO|nr:hypothetical protein [Salmonella enterica]EAA3679417.1 hypothetical protein [Salmonella enterica subsp. houtenae]EAA7386484.1 hypothetical protein [Salmonella enterica subsp. enterica]EBH8098099.1 hypothetical protein [Salmonella enterica subsp. houtenae serovar O:11:g,z25:-]EBI0349477.1 hypothetical protein [Salmonella enterica subsp. arizonae serovar 48:z4,z23,z32:-]EBQ5984439.1 hypothetical protein [Salmonella enterica subsp. houtenae serovar Houten]ECG1390570.1 hypothetical protein [Sa
MATYHLSTRIQSNVPADSLLYDLCIYRMDSDRNKYILVDVKKQSLRDNYETQSHMTENINDPVTTIYIMEVKVYRKTMLSSHDVMLIPFSKMYTLEEFASGKSWSSIKRENPSYFESEGTTNPESHGKEIITIKISQPERPFIAKKYPIGTPQDPFEKNNTQIDIQERFYHRSYPNQNSASVCGPAAFFYCLQMDRPDIYAQAARDLWQYGKTKIGALEIAPGEGCRHPEGTFYNAYGPKITGLDWMTLAGLRDSENAIFSFDTLDAPMAGITMWQTLAEWFEKAGYAKVFSNVGITQAGIQGIDDLNKYAMQGYKVITLINDSLLRDSAAEHTTYPTHWIVWNGPVTQGNDGFVNLNLFSWGYVSDQIKPQKDISFFIRRFFGGVVFKPLK